MKKPMRICFVCLGNICRSPLALAIARRVAEEKGLSQRLHLDSAGLGDWHIGKPADARTLAVAARFGLDLSGHRARQIQPEELSSWDWLVAMDADNREGLLALGADPARVIMMRTPEGEPAPDVPDPYWDGDAGFVRVYRMLARNMPPLLRMLVQSA